MEEANETPVLGFEAPRHVVKVFNKKQSKWISRALAVDYKGASDWARGYSQLGTREGIKVIKLTKNSEIRQALFEIEDFEEHASELREPH